VLSVLKRCRVCLSVPESAGAQQQSDATADAAHRQLHMTTALVGKLMHSVASVCPSVSTAGFKPTDL